MAVRKQWNFNHWTTREVPGFLFNTLAWLRMGEKPHKNPEVGHFVKISRGFFGLGHVKMPPPE